MNVDRILSALNRQRIAYLLIGGMNFLLRHKPIITYDIDIWIEDTETNCARCEKALAALDAEWGVSDSQWGAVARLPDGWLKRQPVYCLTSPHGAIDIFRSVNGLDNWRECAGRAASERTAGGVAYYGLSDEDTLKSQKALDRSDQKPERIRVLEQNLKGKRHARRSAKKTGRS